MKCNTKILAVFAVLVMTAAPVLSIAEESSAAPDKIYFYYDGELKETLIAFVTSNTHTVRSPTGMAGYDFKCWTANGKEYHPGDTITMTEALVYHGTSVYLVSSKTPKTYTAEFVYEGEVIETRSMEFDSQYGELPTVTKPGYELLGWSIDGTKANLVTSADKYKYAYDATFSPVWGEAKFNVDLMDGTELFQTVSCTYKSAYGELPVMTKDGYTFMGWSLNPEGTMIVNSETVYEYTEDSKLYAVWAPISYTISFFDEGVLKGTKSVSFGLAIGELPTLSKKGMSFLGWSTNGDVSGIVTSETKYSTVGDTTLHSVWKAIDYTATFEANGGTLSFETKTFNYGCAIGEFPVTQRDGYNLVGWSMSPDGKSIIDANTPIMSDSDITLYAVWEKNQEIHEGATNDSLFGNPVAIAGLALVILATIAASIWIYRKGLL